MNESCHKQTSTRIHALSVIETILQRQEYGGTVFARHRHVFFLQQLTTIRKVIMFSAYANQIRKANNLSSLHINSIPDAGS